MNMITKYAGMSYEQMSRAAMALIEEAARTGKWHHITDDLSYLKQQMKASQPFVLAKAGGVIYTCLGQH